jgi:hypothetical protein
MKQMNTGTASARLKRGGILAKKKAGQAKTMTGQKTWPANRRGSRGY